MLKRIFSKGREIVIKPQTTIFSAASVIMLMFFSSRALGLVRQRILANFFEPEKLSLFFAAFRLPDLIFEVLVFGTFSSAFIPVFTKKLKDGKADAWETAGRVVNIGLLLFGILALVFSLLAGKIYSIVAPGFSAEENEQIVGIARILFAAQGFFIISYVLTGVLESLRRFLIPALAPIFYNLGIIIGTVVLAPKYGLLAPAIGVVMGSILHFLTQLPLAYRLGFRFTSSLSPNKDVKDIGKLALPRIIDLSFDQIGKTVELFLASVISKASYTYFTFANSLQLLPVSLFGTSLAKAALPILSSQENDHKKFKSTFILTILQAVFFTTPVSVILIVLRIPVVRLVYGTNIFGWEATVQTGEVLSFFAVGVVLQVLLAISVRAFFALRDTRTPVYVSLAGLAFLVSGDFILVRLFGFPVWALAASFSFSVGFEVLVLLFLLQKRIGRMFSQSVILRVVKILTASAGSGLVMFFLLKFFDRSVWVKRLSFLGAIDSVRNLPFERFVLDTRYTINLIILTAGVSAVGLAFYVGILFLLKSYDLWAFTNLFKRALSRYKISPISTKESETISPPTTDSNA